MAPLGTRSRIDANNDYDQLVIHYFIDYSKFAHAHSVQFTRGEFLATGGPGILCQGVDAGKNPGDVLRVYAPKIFFD